MKGIMNGSFIVQSQIKKVNSKNKSIVLADPATDMIVSVSVENLNYLFDGNNRDWYLIIYFVTYDISLLCPR